MAYTSIDNPELYFQTKLYTGTGSSHAITLDGSENLSPNLVWIKCRNDSHNHQVFDSVRGVHKRMRTDTDGAETESSESLKSFDSDGFTLGTQANVNNSSNTFVSWNWKESATAGFDIVSYTGNETNRTISHSLSAVPKMIIVKNRDTTHNWYIYHSSLGAGYEILLNTTAAKDTTSQWNSTAPTSSVFSIGNSAFTNGNSNNIIAYLFADKQGFSKVGGSYTGNGNADGTFVYTGFKPAFVMSKYVTGGSAGGEGWNIFDNKRDPFNIIDLRVQANSSSVESSSTNHYHDFLSNGFKLRTVDGSANNSGATYIYLAFAEAPFVNSNGVPCNAR